tara:strand:- start:18295 stop:19632 length:1338 start_codon:yes stop_codon:yes gene_type:complete
MKLLVLLFSVAISSLAFANLHQAPPNLDFGNNTAGVFVDFKTAKSVLIYNFSSREVLADTTIEFYQPVKGMPVFDLVTDPSKVLIDGLEVSTQSTSMDGVSRVRFINKVLEPGLHTLSVSNEVSKNVSFSSTTVRSAFWMSDLSDRRYMEQYLPSNLEYDQYQTELEVKIIGTDREHQINTNGSINELSKNHWKIQYPAVYTASSYFYHLFEKDAYPEDRKIYKSIDGRDIPVLVYTNQSVSRFMNETLKVLAELEADYGPWPHAQVIIYGAGQGGMEHCGATITSYSALGHELIHSYFARGIMPAHGNSGWVDEAIASWRDAGYPGYSSRSLSRTDMAGHSTYQRTTDRDAYTKGMRFIGHLHSKLESQDNFKVFLKSFFTERKFKPFKTHEFKAAIESFYSTDLSNEFDLYIYGKKGVDKDHEHQHENPNHPKLSEQDLLNLL